MEQVAPGVVRLDFVFVNAYLVGEPGGPWVLVDTALPQSVGRILSAAAERYGPRARPEAIILTHGHADHAGAARDLAAGWGVPVYAHPMELPYLTGKSEYPPKDPTVGGAIAFLSRFFPQRSYDLADRVRPLPEDGTLPGMSGWRWVHTPGHAPGQISLFREADRVLLAGDALATMDLDEWVSLATRKPEFAPPPAPFTYDWGAAWQSIHDVADLNPDFVAAGHGRPITGPLAAEELRRFAERSAPPRRGRYVTHPAHADERGVVDLPPPVPDPLPKVAIGLAAGLAVGAAFAAAARRKKKEHENS